MALREELDNYNAEIVVGPEDDPQVTNAQLAVEEWNRTTVADGAWLQQNAIGPLSARDIVLANAIDDTNDALAELSGKMADVDGRSLKSINGRFFSGGSEIWQGSDPAIVPDGTGVKNDEVIYVPQNDGVILSMNDDAGHAHQLKIKENEIGYRYLAGASTAEGQGNIPGAKYKYDTQAGNFRSVLMSPVGSGNYLATSAGSWSELKFCEDNFSANDNGEITIKYMPGNWAKTEDGYAVLPGSEKESFLHGSNVTVASARSSTIFGQGFSANGYIEESLLVGGTGGGVDGNVYRSIMNIHHTSHLNDARDSIISMTDSSSADYVESSLLVADAAYGIQKVYNSMMVTDDNGSTSPMPNVHDSIVAMVDGVTSGAYSASDIRYSIGNFSQTVSILGDLTQSIINANRGSSIKNVNGCVGHIGSNSHITEYCNRSLLNMDSGSYLAYGNNSILNLNNGTNVITASNSILNLMNSSSVTGASAFLAVGASQGLYDAQHGLSVGDYIQVKGCYNILNVGSGCSAYGASNSILLGYELKTVKPYTVNIGHGNSAEGEGAWTIGTYNKVTTDHQHYLFGDNNRGEDGDYSLLIGNGNYNRGSYNAIHGNGITAHGDYNLFAGSASIAYSDYSLGVGNDIYLYNGKSLAIGDHLKSTNTFQLLLGQYAVSYTDSVLEVGLGTPENTKTVFRIDRNGNVFMAGSLVCGNIQCGVITSGHYPDTMNGGPWTP